MYKTFVEGGNTVKFTKDFTRESFWLHGSLYKRDMNINTCHLIFTYSVYFNGYIHASFHHVVSVPIISVRIVSRADRRYTVTCTVTGGRLSSSSLTGPGLSSSGLSLQRQGSSSDRGENTYSRTSGTLSEDVGSVYTCTVMNGMSSPETSLELAGTVILFAESVDIQYPSTPYSGR